MWDNAGEELIGVEREAVTLISGVNRLGSETNPYLLDDCQIPVVSTDSSSLSCSGEVFEQDYYSTKITIMSEFEKAITKANEYLGTARDYIEIFDVDDVDEGRLPVVERDLDRIMDHVMAYRKQVRLIKESFTLSEAQTVALDNESKNLLSEAKSHAKLIRNKVQQVAPSRSMSAFEKASLEQQKKNFELQELALKEQREHQAKLVADKKSAAEARISVSHQKITDACSQLVLDVQTDNDDDDWTKVDDDFIRKSMQSKHQWVKQLDVIKEDFVAYKTLVTTFSPSSLLDEESDYKQLLNHYELAVKTVEDSVEAVEKEDTSRNLYTLHKDIGSKLEYPKFSGKFSECFLKFKEKMERAFKANRVPLVDQVDKLRENLSGFALSLVPETTKDIKIAFEALSD